ncbi:MAG: putative oxidoreductase [Planctomycetes bacterium ADurb.Bin126]|nr:MAG: putative oxidoreductase [Planctomycetes bacterium ADurb.Bin126]HQL72165.1 Gfo/Idh/MocA family oxidoreductase [Phycisphaerae bacterium]
MHALNRRSFLKGALGSAAAAATIPMLDARSYARVLGANDRLRIGVAGVNGRGMSHVGAYQGMKDVELAYLIDPDKKVLERRLSDVKKKQPDCPTVCLTDVRKALEDKNLDAISTASPNHWHALMVIWSAQAGKHCYVEKPACHDVYQGQVAVAAAKKYKTVIQHGTQQRSSDGRASLMKAIQEGKFGKLKISHGLACKSRGGIGHKDFCDPPATLDWDLWRGPACLDKFHPNYVHYNWHWFWATGNGELNNQGTHQLDVARWALDPSLTAPVRVMALGGRFMWDDQGQTPNTMFGLAEFPNGQWMFFNVRNYGHKGYVAQVDNYFYFADGGKIVKGEYFPKGSTKGEKVKTDKVQITPGGAFGSFIAACRANKPEMSNADMVTSHYSCLPGHLMNISYRLGEKVPFNAKAGRFGDNKDAAEQFMALHEMMRGAAGVPEDKAQYTVGPWLSFDPKTETFTGERADEANKMLREPYREGFEPPAPDKV